MDLNLETDYRYTIASAFHAEEQISFYLRSLFNQTETDFTLLAIYAQVKDEGSISDARTSLETVVTMEYIAEEPKMVANLLVNRIVPATMAERLQVPSLSVAYDNILPTLRLQNIPDVDDGRPKADKGLIAITVFLAIALLIVASVVLYITGGWQACQHFCINCLFEEIEEDEDDYTVSKKATFQVQSYDEEDQRSEHEEKQEEEEDDDVKDTKSELESHAPSEMTNDLGMRRYHPEGLLGASQHPNPAAGLGIKTPTRADTSGYDSASNMTPMSELTQEHGALGITSMRKLPLPDDTDDEDVEGGLAHLILKRRFREAKA